MPPWKTNLSLSGQNENIHLPSDFIAQRFSGNNSDFLTYPLVCVEIKGQPCVILLNDNFRRFLDGLSPDTTLENDSVLLQIRPFCATNVYAIDKNSLNFANFGTICKIYKDYLQKIKITMVETLYSPFDK